MYEVKNKNKVKITKQVEIGAFIERFNDITKELRSTCCDVNYRSSPKQLIFAKVGLDLIETIDVEIKTIHRCTRLNAAEKTDIHNQKIIEAVEYLLELKDRASFITMETLEY